MQTDNLRRCFYLLLMTIGLVRFSQPVLAESPLAKYKNVQCEGSYAHHLQGVTVDATAIYWSFTTQLVKTDLNGKRLKQIPVVSHHGDLCHDNGKLYVAVNLGKFNDPQGNANSWVYVYNAEDLSFIAKHETQEVFHGAGGIGIRAGHFFVVGGLPKEIQVNYVYEYDQEFKFLKRHEIASGQTYLGIQSATFAHDRYWFGCYGTPKILLVTDAKFKMLGRHEFDCSLGIVGIPGQQFLSASGRRHKETGYTGRVNIAVADKEQGLRYLNGK